MVQVSQQPQRNHSSAADRRGRRLARALSPAVWVCLLLAAVVVVVFWPAVGCDFTNYDDPAYFSENPHVLGGLSWSKVKWALRTTDNASWYPVTWLSFLMDATLFGRGAVGPHLMNLLFHAANTVLVFLLLRRLTRALWRSALVAALFGLHPLRVESVAWIAERKGLLSAFFGLLCLWAYAAYVESKVQSLKSKAACALPGNAKGLAEMRLVAGQVPRATDRAACRTYSAAGYYVLALVLFALGLMSKPILVTLPAVLLLLDYWPLQRLENRTPGERRSLWVRLILEKIPFLVLSLVFSIVTVWVHKEYDALVPLANASVAARLQNGLAACAQYLGKALWPVGLALPYPYAGQVPLNLSIFGLALVAGLSLAAFLVKGRRPYLLVGWFWFLVTLVPVLGLIQWGSQAIADRFTYMPLLGLFLVATWSVADLVVCGRVPRWTRVVVVVVVLGACALRSANQLRCWRNSESLFRHTLTVTANNLIALNNLGAWLTVQNRPAEAIVFLRQALQMNPANVDTLYNLGNALAEQGRFEEAATNFQAAVALKPEYYQARNNLAKAWTRLGRFSEAIEQYRLALHRKPDDPMLHKNFAEALGAGGNFDEAIAQYQIALTLAPGDAPTHYALGLALAVRGKWEEAIYHYAETLRLKPNDSEAHYNLGYALKVQAQFDQAATHLREAVRLRPEFPLAHYNLGCVLAKQGRPNEAVAHLKEALRLKPDYEQARQELKTLQAALEPEK